MMAIMLLHFIQRKEGYLKETSGKHSKMRRLHQLQVMIREKACQRSNASDVTSMDTLQEIVLPERKEDNMLPPLTLIQTYLRKMKTMRITSSNLSQEDQIQRVRIIVD
jgi:hypothetical protein